MMRAKTKERARCQGGRRFDLPPGISEDEAAEADANRMAFIAVGAWAMTGGKLAPEKCVERIVDMLNRAIERDFAGSIQISPQ